MAVGVVDIEKQPMTHLVLQGCLKRTVVRVDLVLPNAETAVVLVQAPAQTVQGPAIVVDNSGKCTRNWVRPRQERARLAIDVFGAEQLVTGGSDVLDVNNGLRHDLALNAQVEVVNVWIADSRREDDSREQCRIRVMRVTTLDVSMVLGLAAGAGVSDV